MASTIEVRQYLAHWFQLGKTVTIPNGHCIAPAQVLRNDRYTPEFEECWRQTIANQDAYLEGTVQTVAELLTDRWDVVNCARCTMPIPLPAVGLPQDLNCTCHDLATWPNSNLPLPRAAGDVRNSTLSLRQRLAAIPQP
jgi:hypothetical protein